MKPSISGVLELKKFEVELRDARGCHAALALNFKGLLCVSYSSAKTF